MITQTPIPDYYRGMYRDGFTPWQIIASAHKKMIAEAMAKKPQPDPAEDYNLHITSEVRVKK